MVWLPCCQGHGALTWNLLSSLPWGLSPAQPWARTSLESWHQCCHRKLSTAMVLPSPVPSPGPCPAILGLWLILVSCTKPEPDPHPWGYILAWPCPIPMPRELLELLPGFPGSWLGYPWEHLLPLLFTVLWHVVSNLPNTTVERPLWPFQLRKINPERTWAKVHPKEFCGSYFMIFHQQHSTPL